MRGKNKRIRRENELDAKRREERDRPETDIWIKAQVNEQRVMLSEHKAVRNELSKTQDRGLELRR